MNSFSLRSAALLLMSVVGGTIVSLSEVWSQPRRPIANDPPRTTAPGGNRTPTTTRPGTTAPTTQQRSNVTQPAAQPTQQARAAQANAPNNNSVYGTCNCLNLLAIEDPIERGTLARHVALGGGGYGMGGDIRTYVANPYLVDSYDYTINPAFADRFRDAIFLNVGSVAVAPSSALAPAQPLSNFGGQSFGAIFSISPRVTVGGMVALESNPGITALNTDVASAMAAFALLTFPNWTGGTLPTDLVGRGVLPLRSRNSAYLSTSYNTGGVAIGAGISYVNSVLSPIATNPAQPPQPQANLTQVGFNAGVLITTNTASVLDLSATLLLPTLRFPVPNNTTATQSFSGTVIGANVRYITRISPSFWLIPMANFYSISSPATGSITAFDAGLGMNYRVGPLLFVGGAGASATSGGNLSTVSPVASELILPRFNLGAEYAATNWLRLRAGYSHTTANRTIRATSATPEAIITTYNNYSLINGGVSLGFGLVFGGFTFDVTTDTESIRRGFGGIGTTPSFGYVSAIFKF